MTSKMKAVTTLTTNNSSNALTTTTSTSSVSSNGRTLDIDPHRSAQQVRQRAQTNAATVLDDDTFVDAARSIIERDFFPDLARLRARSEWIDARDRNDLSALMELRMQHGNGSLSADTPLALQTPLDDGSGAAPARVTSNGDDLPTLNEFVASHISEDDKAYSDLVERDHVKFRERVCWLEESAIKAQQQLTAPNSDRGRVKMWPFEVRNALMWYPHAIDDPAALAAAGDPAKSISKANTRFAVPAPVNKRRRVGTQTTEPGLSARNETDELGYVQTPTLNPGIDVAPIMTWGKIASTPQRLQDGEDDFEDDEDDRALLATFGVDKGPIGQFKVAQMPSREAAGHSLATAAQERRRVRTSLPAKSQPRHDATGRVALSPAAARLAHTLTPRRGATPGGSGALSLGAVLRRSYSTPSPSPKATPVARK